MLTHMCRLSVVVVGAALVLAPSGCAKPAAKPVEVHDPITEPVEPEPKLEKRRIYDFSGDTLEGVVFQPAALAVPELPGAGKVVKRTIDQQRKRWQKAKAKTKAAEAWELAMLLWHTPAPANLPVAEADKMVTAQRVEALALLEEVVKDAKATEAQHQARAAALHAVGDADQAAAAWDALVARFPDSDQVMVWKAYRDYLDLRAGRPATHELGDDQHYQVLYVVAWQRFRAGSGDVVPALTAAANAWTSLETLPLLRREVMLLCSRAGAPADETVELIEQLAKKEGGDWVHIAPMIAEAYNDVGEYEAALAIYQLVAENAPPARLAVIRAAQARGYYRLFRLDESADAAIAALAAADAAGNQLDAEIRKEIEELVADFGMLYHNTYSKTMYAPLAEPARRLYQAYLQYAPNGEMAKQIEHDYLPDLDETEKRIAEGRVVGGGAMDKAVIRRRLRAALERVTACYERALQREPTLAGTITLHLVIEGSSANLRSLSIEPGPGDTGLGRVAACVQPRLQDWPFVPATGDGTVEVHYPIELRPAGS